MHDLGKLMASEIAETPKILADLTQSEVISDEILSWLKSSKFKSVIVLARGTSDNAAHFCKYLIETQLGLPCGLASPSSVTIYHSDLEYDGTLVIAISQSGQSTDLVEFAKKSKLGRARLLAITNDSDSPLAKQADFHVPLGVGPELAVAATKSYAAQLLISYLLVMGWAEKQTLTADIETESIRVLGMSQQIAQSSKLLDLGKQIVILGRGFSYGNAKELALKIQETCKVNVSSYSTADYLHGPISALTPETQVILLAPNDMPLSLIEGPLSRIREITNRIFWIGQSLEENPGETRIGGSACSDELKSAIVDAIVLHRFVLELAVSNGFDPDSPAGLSKVTRTL